MAKKASALNRIARWHPRDGVTCEADPRHAEIIRRDTGAENLKTVSTPAANETGKETEEEKRQDLQKAEIEWKAGKQDER